MRPTLTYWMVRVSGAQIVGGSSFAAATLDGVYLSPTTKLASVQKGAMLDSLELAEAFASALQEVISRRQGAAVRLTACECGVSGAERSLAKYRANIVAHSDEVRERLRTGQFAPNRKVLASG